CAGVARAPPGVHRKPEGRRVPPPRNEPRTPTVHRHRRAAPNSAERTGVVAAATFPVPFSRKRPRRSVLLVGVLQEIRLDEGVEIAVQNGLDIAGLVLGPEVLHQLIGLQDVAPDLVSPGDLSLGRLEPRLLRSALRLLDLVQARLE